MEGTKKIKITYLKIKIIKITFNDKSQLIKFV